LLQPITYIFVKGSSFFNISEFAYFLLCLWYWKLSFNQLLVNCFWHFTFKFLSPTSVHTKAFPRYLCISSKLICIITPNYAVLCGEKQVGELLFRLQTRQNKRCMTQNKSGRGEIMTSPKFVFILKLKCTFAITSANPNIHHS